MNHQNTKAPHMYRHKLGVCCCFCSRSKHSLIIRAIVGYFLSHLPNIGVCFTLHDRGENKSCAFFFVDVFFSSHSFLYEYFVSH